jgi:hypothetical protein
VSATGLTKAAGSCLYVLDPSGSGTLTIAGSSLLTSACGLYVDSNSSSAAVANGGGTITAPLLGVVGGTTIHGGASLPVTTAIPGFGDPLGYLGVPSMGSCASYAGKTDNGNKTENPGLFCGGLTIASSANVTLNPRLYVLNGGGLTIKGNVTGNGVTFYLTGTTSGAGKYAGVTINSGTTATLKAPNTCSDGVGNPIGGSINGVLMFQDRSVVGTSSNQSTISGGATSSFDGALYFPTTTLNYSGNSAGSGYTYLVAYDLKIAGNSNIGNNYSCLNGGSSIIQSAALVM